MSRAGLFATTWHTSIGAYSRAITGVWLVMITRTVFIVLRVSATSGISAASAVRREPCGFSGCCRFRLAFFHKIRQIFSGTIAACRCNLWYHPQHFEVLHEFFMQLNGKQVRSLQSLYCPRNGKQVWVCHRATVFTAREGGKSSLASPDTGLRVGSENVREAHGGSSAVFSMPPYSRCLSPSFLIG